MAPVFLVRFWDKSSFWGSDMIAARGLHLRHPPGFLSRITSWKDRAIQKTADGGFLRIVRGAGN